MELRVLYYFLTAAKELNLTPYRETYTFCSMKTQRNMIV